MTFELTYHGGRASTAASVGAGGYSPKTSKPLARLPCIAYYAIAEHHPLFALIGMHIATAIISITSLSGSSSSIGAVATPYS